MTETAHPIGDKTKHLTQQNVFNSAKNIIWAIFLLFFSYLHYFEIHSFLKCSFEVVFTRQIWSVRFKINQILCLHNQICFIRFYFEMDMSST